MHQQHKQIVSFISKVFGYPNHDPRVLRWREMPNTYKFPQQIPVLELPHRSLQSINWDDIAVSQVGNPSVTVSGGTERVQSFTIRVNSGATIKPSVDETINRTCQLQGEFISPQKFYCNMVCQIQFWFDTVWQSRRHPLCGLQITRK